MSGLVSKVSKVFLTSLTSNACHLEPLGNHIARGRGAEELLLLGWMGSKSRSRGVCTPRKGASSMFCFKSCDYKSSRSSPNFFRRHGK